VNFITSVSPPVGPMTELIGLVWPMTSHLLFVFGSRGLRRCSLGRFSYKRVCVCYAVTVFFYFIFDVCFTFILCRLIGDHVWSVNSAPLCVGADRRSSFFVIRGPLTFPVYHHWESHAHRFASFASCVADFRFFGFAVFFVYATVVTYALWKFTFQRLHSRCSAGSDCQHYCLYNLDSHIYTGWCYHIKC